MVTLESVQTAADRIRHDVIRTPLLVNETLDASLGCRLFFKAENLQHTGAFKARGAANAVRNLPPQQADSGVVTHSSGNHAAALARMARRVGIAAHVVMPHNSSVMKINAVRSYGVEPIFCEPASDQREAKAAEVMQQTGATMVHPFESHDVICGQGTMALELLEQVDDLDAVIVPVGGGGLLAGTLTSLKNTRPSIRVCAAEPAWADDTFRSLQSGQHEQPARYDTIGDGLRTQVGQQTLPIIRQFLDDIFLVTETEIAEATRTLIQHTRTIVEPSGAVAFAALSQQRSQFAGQRVAVVISGGNLDLSQGQYFRG